MREKEGLEESNDYYPLLHLWGCATHTETYICFREESMGNEMK